MTMRIESLGIFFVPRFGGIYKPTTNKDLAFVTVPFSFTLQQHLWWHFFNTLHMLRSKKQTCGHMILKYQEKRQVNTCTIVKGISHMQKSFWWPVWSLLDRSPDIEKTWGISHDMLIGNSESCINQTAATQKASKFLFSCRWNDLKQTNTLFLLEKRNQTNFS